MKKIGRNDPCHCGSGKKFKKCCESKMIGGRYMATKMNQPTGLSGLFNRQVSQISSAAAAHVYKPIRATAKAAAPAVSAAPVLSEVPASTTPVEAEKIEQKEILC